MKLLRDIHSTSEFLFYLIGTLLLVAFLFWRNESYTYQAEVFLRYADLPFAFVSLLFLGTGIRLYFSPETQEEEENEKPILDAILVISGLTLFFIILYIDFAFPNVM